MEGKSYHTTTGKGMSYTSVAEKMPFEERCIPNENYIQAQRNIAFQKSYNEQSYLFSKLTEIRETVQGKWKVNQTIPPLGKVCQIQVLLKKNSLG